jgi:membrane fusion protein (multidrug efflux system)
MRARAPQSDAPSSADGPVDGQASRHAGATPIAAPIAETVVRTDKRGPGSVVGVALLILGAASLAVWQWTRADSAPAEAQAQRGAPVVTASVARDDMLVSRRYPGEVFAEAAEVSSRVEGHVESIHVRIGDRVEAGQILAEIDDAIIKRQLKETQAQIAAQRSAVASSEVARKAAERQVDRVRDLVDKGVISAQEVDDLETALAQRDAEAQVARARRDEAQARLSVLRENLDDTSVRAPFAGSVARRDLDPGAFVQPGTPILRVVADDPLRVRFRVPEGEVEGIRSGLRFRLRARVGGETSLGGEVTRMSGEVSPEDRTLLVEGVISERGSLRPGMYADVELGVRELSGVRVVSDAAVLERVDARGQSTQGVFVLRDGTARWVDVRVIGREAGRVAIDPTPSDALADTDPVLVRGHRELSDDTPVRVVEETPSP